MRNWLDRLNPIRQLPKPMRRYLAMPNRLFLAWLVLSGFILVTSLPGQTETSQPATSIIPPEQDLSAPPVAANLAVTPQAPRALAVPHSVANIAVSGLQSFTVIGKDGRIFVTPQGQPALVLANDADGLQVQTEAGALVYRLKLKGDEQGKVYDAAGGLRYRLKCETEDNEETCELYDGQAALLNRIKLKQDSFNVYGPGSQRLYKGKLKNGQYVLKTEADEGVLNIKGVNTLKAAALLALPVEISIRALLWHHADF